MSQDSEKVGADKVMDVLRREGGCPMSRSGVFRTLKKIKGGKNVYDIVSSHGKGRGGNGGSTKRPVDATIMEKVKNALAGNPCSTVNSARLMAMKFKSSKSTVSRCVKKLGLKPFKRVKTCATTALKNQKRAAGAKAILDGLEGQKWHTDTIFWSDESLFDTNGNRFNVQNNRFYAPKSAKRDDILQDLIIGQKHKGPGVMLFLCVSSIGGGLVFEPHVVPPKTTVTGEYYIENIMKPLIPRMRAAMLQKTSGTKWAYMQDQASPHTAKPTIEFFKTQKIKLLPWFPSGADANPLDIMVWDSIKNKLGELPKEQYNTVPKLEASLLHVIQQLRESTEWLQSVAHCCEGVPRRLKWISKNGGQKIVGKKWKTAV